MIEIAVDLAKKQDVHRLWLKVIEENKAAVLLYEKIGFEVEGRMRSFSLVDNKQYHDSLIMGILLDA